MNGYNQEAISMQVINMAHKAKGIFTGSAGSKERGIWLKFKFETHTGVNIFDHNLRKESVGKGIILGKDKTCQVLV